MTRIARRDGVSSRYGQEVEPKIVVIEVERARDGRGVRVEGRGMFDDERMVGGGARDDGAAHVGDDERWDWQTIDRRMRRLAARRAALDAEEARLLVIARRMEIHRELGYGSFDEYLE